MPALTHGRVQNGFNGHATNTQRCNQILVNGKNCGGVCCSGGSLQPLKANGGGKPKRNFKAQYNAQVNAPNALTNSIGSSFTTKRANARRAGDPNRKLLGLPEVSWSAPGLASRKRKVPLDTPNSKKTVYRINETNYLFINSGITLTDSGGTIEFSPGLGYTPVTLLPDDYKDNENEQILIQAPVGRKISITGRYCVESSLQDVNFPVVDNIYAGWFDFIKIYNSKQSYIADPNRDNADPTVTSPGSTSGLLWFSSKAILDDGAMTITPQDNPANFYFPIRTINETSPSNQIYVHFKSDFDIVASGFDFQVNIV